MDKKLYGDLARFQVPEAHQENETKVNNQTKSFTYCCSLTSEHSNRNQYLAQYH